MNDNLFELSKEAVRLLDEKKLKVATAESCTGGLLSSYLTSVKGASGVFEMGVCSYSCRIKNEALDVKNETLDKYGAISAETASQMAEGILKKADADIGLSVTGVAGPNTSEGKPVGLVYIAAATKEKTVVERLDITPKGREFIRNSAVEKLLILLLKTIGEV